MTSICVLTARPGLATNRRLAEAAGAAGLRLDVVDALQVVAGAGAEPTLQVGASGRSLTAADRVLARVGNWRPESVLAALEVMVDKGARPLNSPAAIRRGRDHWRTVHELGSAGLPVAETVAAADPEVLAAAGARLGFPVVVKQRRSRMGVGVIRCSSRDHLEAVVDSLWRLGDEIVVQRWVESGGRSRRAVVAGGELVAAAGFAAARGEWRSNAARGGHAEAVSLTAGERELAVAAAATLGLGLAGVDLLEGPDGPVVVEVNPTPGFVHLERATGVDVAAAIVRALAG